MLPRVMRFLDKDIPEFREFEKNEVAKHAEHFGTFYEDYSFAPLTKEIYGPEMEALGYNYTL